MKRENFDFYSNTLSYFKVLKRFLPEEINEAKEELIHEICNYLFPSLDEVRIMEMQLASGLLENRLLQLPKDQRSNCANELYGLYAKPIIYSYCNGDFGLANYFFDNFDVRVKEISGFKGLYGENGVKEAYEIYHR